MKGASTNQLSQRILLGSLIDYLSNSVFDLVRFHQFGSAALPRTLLEYVWYAGGRKFGTESLW